MHDSARASVRRFSRKSAATTSGSSRPSSLKTRPGSRSWIPDASSWSLASASSSDAPVATRCSSVWPAPPRIVVRGFVKVL